MPAVAVFASLCPKGNALFDEEKHEGAHLARLARRAQLPVPPPEVHDLLAKGRAKRDDVRVELSRHVAHCTDGCQRAPSAEQAPAFTTERPFERAPANQKKPVPPAGELAQLLRDGQALEDLADEYERHPSTLISKLHTAGYSTSGQPKVTRSPDTPPVLEKPFKYELWMDDSLCAQTDPESFFPEKGGSTRDAKSTCARCTVAAECLDYALANNEMFGIWGGLSERERRALKNFPTDQTDTIQETA